MPNTNRENDFEGLFDLAPISLWLEDYSALRDLFEGLRLQGVHDLAAAFDQDPMLLPRCAASIQILRVNRQTLKVFAAPSQAELVQHLAEVFGADTLQPMREEMLQLWHGATEFSSRTVNYGLDGRRMDVLIHVRILPGSETTWERVMVSLEDVTESEASRSQLARSEQYARDLFDHSPVSLWVEDFSGVKRLLDDIRAMGITDFRTFLNVHPDFVTQCMAEIRVIGVNRQTLVMFGASSQEVLLGNLNRVFRDEMHGSFAEQLIDLWEGRTVQTREVVNYALGGDLINIHMQFAVLQGQLADWSLVLVSLIDITARKKAEAYLEYLGKHDALTKLRNRAFFVDELNRITRKGPWPLTVIALDLNGLKHINDTEGHAAGDALLRRAGEVLSSATTGQPYCVARIGGDEFIILLPGCDGRVAEALHERIESLIELNNQFYPGYKLSLAMGIASASNAASVEAALHAADQAMFHDKTRYYDEHRIERRRLNS